MTSKSQRIFPGFRLASHAMMTLGWALSMSGNAWAQPTLGQAGANAESIRVQRLVEAAYPALEAAYQHIHATPEVAFQETATAAFLAQGMRKLGFDVTERVGKTGIVAIFRNGPGPTVMVRTELDGLPMEEKTGLPYASRHQQDVGGKLSFVAHSCGHDIHMAWWLGAATALVQDKANWRGTLMFVAQPAEETLAGAKAMLADGLFTKWPKPDFAFAAHVVPLPAGQIVAKQGAMSAAADTAEITFIGKGAHGSMPQNSVDPIVIGAHFVSDVQAVISREKEPSAFGVVTVGSFSAGTVPNIIPDRAILKLTIRSNDQTVQQGLIDGVVRTARASADMARAPAPIITMTSSARTVYNDPALTQKVGTVLETAFGGDVTVIPANLPPISSASEDFSEFVDAGVPSVFLAIGGLPPPTAGIPQPVNHSPDFAPLPPPSITRGAEAIMMMVLAVAGQHDADTATPLSSF